MTKFSEISITIFIAGSLILLFGPRNWFPDFYNPGFMGAMGFLAAFLIFFASFIFKSDNEEKRKEALYLFQNIISGSLLLNAAGALGFYQFYRIGFEYDKLLHFIIPALLVFGASYFFYHWYKLKLSQAILLAALAVLLLGFIWEIFEFYGDWIFKVNMLGHYGKFIVKDTIWDLIWNFLGTISGAIFVVKKVKNNQVTA